MDVVLEASVFVQLRAAEPGFDESMHRSTPQLPEQLAAVRAFEDHLVGEVAYHLRRCGTGGADPTSPRSYQGLRTAVGMKIAPRLRFMMDFAPDPS